ncbi:MAG TPA: hypothetical protein VN903_00850 [Polyangia bacterium]|nr:hypothetical protein [Polyangia bacterium]
MAWVRLADDFADHPKLVAAGPLAGWLWLCGIAYSNRYLTDGFIPGGAVRRLADIEDTAALVARLVDVGLWEHARGGYRVHDYESYQPTAESVRAERARNAERVAKWRDTHGNAISNAGSNAITNGVGNAGSTGPPGPGPGTGLNPVPDPAPARSPDPNPAGTSPQPPPQAAGGRRSRRRISEPEPTSSLTPEEIAAWQQPRT